MKMPVPFSPARKIRLLLVLALPFGITNVLAAEGLLLTGYNASYFDNLPDISPTTLSAKTLCGPDGVNHFVASLGIVKDRVNQRFGQSSISASELQEEAQQTRKDLCADGGGFQLDTHAITYTACRMNMDTPSLLMDLRLPSSKIGGSMEMINYDDAEIVRFPIEGTSGAAAQVESSDARIQWSGPGDSKKIAGYKATRYDYSYTMSMGAGSGNANAMGMSLSTVNTGHGYFARDVPGLSVLDDFHEQFTREVSAAGGASIYGGLMGTLVEMLDKGMPLEMDQTITSKMGGMAMGGGRSRMKITGYRVVDLPSAYCDQVLAPTNFAVSDAPLGQMGMTIQAGDQSGSEDDSDSPFGALMKMMDPDNQGAGGFANPAAPQSAPQATQGNSANVRSTPSSSDLTTDDMTQSVQLHLQALGIEPGNTDGNLDLNTQIAISQFQAQKGLSVTGEVSPQLLGILAAEVDKGR